MKLLLSILAFAAYTDASAQFYNPSIERMNRDIEYRELKQQREEMLDLQREALRLQREALEQQQADALTRSLNESYNDSIRNLHNNLGIRCYGC